MKVTKTSDKRAISKAIEVLKRGGLVIFPTETCYGIAADCKNQQAIDRLLSYKGDRYRQVSIAVSSQRMADEYVDLNDMAKNIYREFLPGPITVISTSLHKLDPRLESEQHTLGVRFPKHDFALRLIIEYGSPITATSANTSGKKEPYSLQDWRKYTSLKKQDMVDLFLDAGKLIERPTSTVVDTTLNSPEVLRQGEISLPNSSHSFTSSSPVETQQLASSLTKKYLNLTHKYPLIIALQGDLGTGKTQFSKGIATVLGINENITSPTYTLMREYPYSLSKYDGIFYHIDTWRLPNSSELESTLKFKSLLNKGNIIALEWAGKAKNELENYKNDYPIILINIKEINEHKREISFAVSVPEWS